MWRTCGGHVEDMWRTCGGHVEAGDNRCGENLPLATSWGSYYYSSVRRELEGRWFKSQYGPKYRVGIGRVSLTRGASLLVDQLTLEDEGWFECRILLLDRQKDDFRNGTWTFLSITAPPVFIKTPPTFVEVLLGDSLTLSCGAHGNPRPTVVWHKDERRIEKHEKIKVLNGTLSVAAVSRNFSGVYKCHVSNSEGNLTHSMQLQVKGPPIIIISPEDTTLNMSQDAVLQCQADAYPSNLTYEWLKQGQNVYHIESLKSRVKVLVDGTLLIPNLIPEDAGNYTCIPTNGLLTPPSASAHLKVKHPARVVRMSRETYLPAGMEGVITCPVQADPPVLYVNWTKDGSSLNLDNLPGWIVNSEGSVFIATANDNAVGMYTCTAYNSYGTMGKSEPTKVILQDPPSFRVPPRAEYLQEVGRTLIIPCEAIGDPAPNITWSKRSAHSPSTMTTVPALTVATRLVARHSQPPWWSLLSGCSSSEPLASTVYGERGLGPIWEEPDHNRLKIMAPKSWCHPVPTEGPTADASLPILDPPGLLSANRTDRGFLLQWSPPEAPSSPLTGYVLQARRDQGQWVILSSNISANQSQVLVEGLLRDSSYDLRLMSLSNKVLSEPSESVNVSTTGPSQKDTNKKS
ncbi:protein turtle homolog B-like [Etheostoma cragini]|uniref:protein turtle homolog B-like n=1 Tax=Etheostoma cragini TaxID=417921 RepID=UPI00155F35DD|nr:protein turtle homolog B-like [Etheostoma cragini]